MSRASGRGGSAGPWRVIAGVLGALVIVAALLIGALRFALARVPDNAARIQGWIERQTGLRLDVDAVDARLRWYGPEVVLKGVSVLDRDETQALFETREATVALDAWSLFRTGELVAGRVAFVEPAVTVVRLADGRIRLLGLRERPADRPPFDFDRLPAGELEIIDAKVHFRDLRTGRGPWTLENVRVSLQRGERSVDVRGHAQLPGQIGSRIEFDGWLRGALDRFTDLEARLSLDVDRLELAGLAEFVPAGRARPLSGSGTANGSLHVSHGQLRQARLDLALSDVALELPARATPAIVAVQLSAPYRPAGSSPLSMPVADTTFVERPAPALPAQARYASIGGRLRLRQDGDGWLFRAVDLRLQRTPGETVAPAGISGRWSGRAASAFDGLVDVNGLDLAAAWPLALAFAPPRLDPWSGLDPSGRIDRLRAGITRERAGSDPRWTVAAEFSGIAAKPVSRWPGLAGLSGALSGTDQRGRLGLRSDAPSFEWPRLFREPITGRLVAADVDWRRDGEGWVLASSDVAIDHEQANVRGSFEASLPMNGRSPVLAIDASVDRLDAGLVPRVLPIGRLKPRTAAWLSAAFGQGTATQGRFVYRGPTRKFPFRNGEGEFYATATVDGIRLDYFPGFAPLTDAAGTVEFRNAGLRASLRKGAVGGLTLDRAVLDIADVKEPVLDIDAAARGDLAKALAVLQGSPLGPRLGRQFMSITGQGRAEYALRLRLPTQDPESRDYRVRATLEAATVALPVLKAPATNVTGTFEIHNLDIRADSLRGNFLDGPFELSARPGPTGRGVTAAVLLSGTGRAAGPRLPAFIGLPDTIRMSGTLPWKLDGRFERRAAGETWPGRFEVESDLRGLGIDAPAPFAKTPADPRPTFVALDLPAPGRTALRLETGSARAALAFAMRRDGRWLLDRGLARFDGRPASLPPEPGLHFAGDWPEFDLAQWLALRPSQPGATRLDEWLGAADVHLDRVRVLGFEFDDVVARLQPLERSWQVVVDGPMAAGTVVVPANFKGPEALTLDMRRLSLRSAKSIPAAGRAREADPRELPALVVRVDDFTWEGRRFGRLAADLAREPLGLRLERLTTESPDFQLRGSGSWFVEADGSRTRLSLDFSSTDLAAAARALGYRPGVEAESASAVASVTWPGGPASDVIARTDGTVTVALDRGQLRGVEPGAGRMLGLLSIAELPRRLSLDFRDVTGEGLAFDTVRGDFEVRAGNAYTQNLLVKGASIDLGVVGRTGLASQDYDQTVIVSGNPSGAITVAGALAGGPVGAAGALVLSQLFKGQLQGLARVYYRVTGPWANPVVQRVSAASSPNLNAGAASSPQREATP